METEILESLRNRANSKKAGLLSRFFKTGPGEYGEGDKFLGVMVPKSREVVKEWKNRTSISDAVKLLDSVYHEMRLVGVLLLVEKFKKGSESERKTVYEAYLSNAKKINNWDLVDLSAPNIVGGYLLHKDKAVLYSLAKSSNLWERRISIISSLAFIKEGHFKTTLDISNVLLKDKHDLIHKAVGWMLREVGKKDTEVLREFLKKHASNMPRTALRYSIEKFSDIERKRWLNYRQ